MEQCILNNKNCSIHKPSLDPGLLFSINELDKNCKNYLVSIKILWSCDENADITKKNWWGVDQINLWTIINWIKTVIIIAINMQYIGDCQETVNIRCIQIREIVTLELLHLVKSLVYSKIFLKTIFQSVANYVWHT